MESGDIDEGELKSILDELRKKETRGRKGKGEDYPYARAIYRFFDDIQTLKDDGFTLTTICKFLEGKKILPADSDPRSFCRAFSREASRRKRAAKAKKTEGIHGTVISPNKPKGGAASASAISAAQGTGLQVNANNTFNIKPADLDGLPDL